MFNLGGLYYEVQSTLFIADTEGPQLSSCPHHRESEIGGVYLCQISVIYLCLGFNFCLYYWAIHYSWVSARQELTVLVKCFILHFFIRTLRGQYVFFYKLMYAWFNDSNSYDINHVVIVSSPDS